MARAGTALGERVRHHNIAIAICRNERLAYRNYYIELINSVLLSFSFS